MKYKLINTETKEETLCDKVTIDVDDYYVSGEEIKVGDWYTWDGNKNNAPSLCIDTYNEESILDSQGFTKFYKVIATNNPNIDIPKVVDEVEILANMYCNEMDRLGEFHDFNSFKYAYNKSQETHPFSEEDMIDFAEWIIKTDWQRLNIVFEKTTKELIGLWKEEQHKKVYYS